MKYNYKNIFLLDFTKCPNFSGNIYFINTRRAAEVSDISINSLPLRFWTEIIQLPLKAEPLVQCYSSISLGLWNHRYREMTDLKKKADLHGHVPGFSLAQVLLWSHNLKSVEHIPVFFPELLDVFLVVNLLRTQPTLMEI